MYHDDIEHDLAEQKWKEDRELYGAPWERELMTGRERLEAEAAELYQFLPLGSRVPGTDHVIMRRMAHIQAKTITADWETIVAAMKTEAQEHHIEENLNLGQYRTKYACSCGEEWVTDGYDTAHPQWSFGDHCRRVEASAAFRAAGFYVEEN